VGAGKRPFRFARAARDDLRNGVLWYEEAREGLGARFAADVQKAVELILAAPNRWPVRRRTHRYVLRRFPYTIAYRVVTDQVVILAVAHHRLEPGAWEGR
jgi:plasmid stabilization system protein ParE